MNFTFFRSFEAHAVFAGMLEENIEDFWIFWNVENIEKFLTRVQVDNFHFFPFYVPSCDDLKFTKMIHRYASDVGVDDTKIFASIVCKLLFHTLGMKRRQK